MDENTRKNTLAVIATAFVVVVVVVGALWYLNTQNVLNTQNDPETGIGGGPDNSTTIVDIIQNPNNYTNQSVLLTGSVDRALSSRYFVLDQTGTDNIGDEILVITAGPVSPPDGSAIENALTSAEGVRVSGVVRPFNTSELEQNLGVDIDAQTELEFSDRPVLIATEIAVSEPTQSPSFSQ